MSDSRIGAQVEKHRERDNSMTAKQLVASVRQGRQIHVQLLDEDPFVGYLAGWDDKSYLILVPKRDEFLKIIVNRAQILFIQLLDEKNFRENAFYREMEEIVKPFRDSINAQYAKNDA